MNKVIIGISLCLAVTTFALEAATGNWKFHSDGTVTGTCNLPQPLVAHLHKNSTLDAVCADSGNCTQDYYVSRGGYCTVIEQAKEEIINCNLPLGTWTISYFANLTQNYNGFIGSGNWVATVAVDHVSRYSCWEIWSGPRNIWYLS